MSVDHTALDSAVPLQRFEDQIVFVTGAGSGIGRATALRLAAEGAFLYLADLDEDGLKDTAESCVEHGADVAAHPLDVSDEMSVNDAIDACVGAFGRIDCLCNAAGVVILEHLEKTTVEQFRLLVDVNLLGSFLTIRAAIRHLVETRGNIVNVSSIAALAGVGLATAYGAVKGGVGALSRGVAVEYGGRGVRCNTVVPGRVALPVRSDARNPAHIDVSILGRHAPMPEAATPAMIAAVIAMVASDDGAHLNGSEIRVDGGWLS